MINKFLSEIYFILKQKCEKFHILIQKLNKIRIIYLISERIKNDANKIRNNVIQQHSNTFFLRIILNSKKKTFEINYSF